MRREVLVRRGKRNLKGEEDTAAMRYDSGGKQPTGQTPMLL